MLSARPPGDYPITDYSLAGKLFHLVFFFVAAAFIGIPTGLVIAVFTRELRGARAAMKFLAEKQAALVIQRVVRKMLAQRRAAAAEGIDGTAAARKTVMELQEQSKSAFFTKCFELTGGRPRDITMAGYWYQVVMALMHTFVGRGGVFFDGNKLSAYVRDGEAISIAVLSVPFSIIPFEEMNMFPQFVFFVGISAAWISAKDSV